jgi:galactose-1-phosphate uridylyltransferase
MSIDFRKDDGRLVWVRNPFTGVVTYFTHVHRKRSGFVRRQEEAALRTSAPDRKALESQLRHELEAARRECPFCPGNEHLTTNEVLRFRRRDVLAGSGDNQGWLIRAFYNLIPRIPECCTGDRNESYVVVEDPRHFADDAMGHEDLLYTGLLSPEQFRGVLQAAVETARRSYENPAVASVLIRKNQGRDSGASQPHVHTQVIGSDLAFAPALREAEVMAATPSVWQDIIDFVDAEGFLIERRAGFVSYFCPFGTFPRSYEIVAPDFRGRITELPAAALQTFADLLHDVLCILGPVPLDYEVHDGDDVPFHVHVNSRHFPYSNMGGTLNLPSTLLDRGDHAAAHSQHG